MSIEKVRAYFEGFGIAGRIREFDVSSATVELAAIAVGVEGARIAKSMSFKLCDEPIIVVVAGDQKIDNAKYKAQFHQKAKMLTFDEACALPVTPRAACARSPCRRTSKPISTCRSSASRRCSPLRAAATAPSR